MFSETIIVEPFVVALTLPEAYGLIEEAVNERNAQWPMQRYLILPGDQSRGLQRFQSTVHGLGDPAQDAQVYLKNAQMEAVMQSSASPVHLRGYKDWVTTITLTSTVKPNGPSTTVQLQYEIGANKPIDLVFKVTKIQDIVENTSSVIHEKLTSTSGVRLYNAATAAMQHGDYARALVAISQAVTEFPHDPDFYCVQAMAFAATGQEENAELAFRAGTNLAPGYWRLWFNLGYFYLQSSRHADAQAAFNNALPNCDDPASAREIREYLALIQVESRPVQPAEQKAAEDLMHKFEQDLEIVMGPADKAPTEVRLSDGRVLSADSSNNVLVAALESHKQGSLALKPEELEAISSWLQECQTKIARALGK